MSGKYASDTRVPVSRSRDELYQVLARYGATETFLHETATGLRVGFILNGYCVAFPFALAHRIDNQSNAAYEREVRRRWRVLILVLKGKFESIENGAESPSAAFLPYLMLADGSTVGEDVLPRVRAAYRAGRMPETLLPSLPSISARVIELPSKIATREEAAP